jgi:hypothetical protein
MRAFQNTHQNPSQTKQYPEWLQDFNSMGSFQGNQESLTLYLEQATAITRLVK